MAGFKSRNQWDAHGDLRDSSRAGKKAHKRHLHADRTNRRRENNKLSALCPAPWGRAWIRTDYLCNSIRKYHRTDCREISRDIRKQERIGTSFQCNI